MPEILTKHPEIVIKVLASQGARCGTGAPQKILTKCPADHFCSLAGGELCVFGLGDVATMTQLAPSELCTPAAQPPATGALVPADHPVRNGQLLTISVPLAVAVVVVGVIGMRRRRREATH